MAASQNLQINTWADIRARVIADKITSLRYAIQALLTDYAAEGMAALITADGTTNLVGTQDGRVPITGQQLMDEITVLTVMQTALSTTVIAGVGKTVAAVIDPIQVNGSPR